MTDASGQPIGAVRRYWRNHKTKTLGLLMVAVGAVQSNMGQVQAYLPPRAYGFIIAGLGVLVAILGFLNSHQDRSP